MAAYEVLLLNTAIPQIQAAQSGDTYVVPRDIAINATAIISANSATDALRITQTGAGNAILVEDSANPDSTPFVVNASGIVGIGTTSPTYKLDVVNTSGSVAAISVTANDPVNAKIRLNNTSGQAYSLISGIPTVSQSGFTIYDETNSTSRVVLDSSGNLGIGTTTPQGPLEVAATGATVNQYLTGGTGNNAVTGIFRIGSGAGRGASIQGFRGASSNIHSLDFYTYNAGDVFGMRLDSSGNLGLGVTPSAWAGYTAFQVKSASLASSGVEAVTSQNAYYNAGWKYYATNFATQYSQDSGSHKWFNAPSGTAGTAITFTQAMTLDASGRLGVGRSSLTETFEVGPNTSGNYATGYFVVNGNYGSGIACSNDNKTNSWFIGARKDGIGGSSGTDRFNILYNAGAVATITTGGNLLVGTSSSTGYKFEVLGNGVYLSNTAAYAAYLGQGSVFISGAAATDFGIRSDSNLVFSTGGATERARITSGGDFELGTQGGTGTRTLKIQTNTSGDPTINLTAAGVDLGSFWFERSTSRLYARSSNTGGVYLAAGGTSWTAVSDERKKDIIEPITDAASKVSTLRAVIGKYKTDEDGKRRSFLIAQDVQAVLPEAVDATNSDELGLSYSDMIPLLVAAIKEQQAMINDLKAKVASLGA